MFLMFLNKKIGTHMSFTTSIILLGLRKNIYSLTCDCFEQQFNIQHLSSYGKIVGLGVDSNDGRGISSDNVQVYKFDSISLWTVTCTEMLYQMNTKRTMIYSL